MANISHFTQTVNGISTTYNIHDANAIPRSGGAVLTGGIYCNNTTSSSVYFFGGTAWNNGAGIALYGGTNPDNAGVLELLAIINQGNGKSMWLYPSGTWTWNGTACQIISDQRLKQQIAEIDDKLLDKATYRICRTAD